VVRLHLGFLIGHLFQLLDASNQETVFERLLFPFLLFSKPRQHTAEVVWEAVEQAMKISPDALAFEPLKGCPELVKKDGQIESLVAANLAIASKIAGVYLPFSLCLLEYKADDDHGLQTTFFALIALRSIWIR
jgi:U3 small nucleolar RNA-associated protein 10